MANIVFFHLGLHKTATSWLQQQLFPKLPLPVFRTRKFEKIEGIIARHSGHDIIISHEGLGGRISDSKAPGDALEMFVSSLDHIARLPSHVKVLIGFREHVAWINSAYSQRARKRVVMPEQYRDSYSPDDLSWTRRVRLCEQYGLETFPFLYEEFAHDPLGLLADMCNFLGTSVPHNMADALAQRENPSPKTERGFRISRMVHWITRPIGLLPLVNAKRLRRIGSQLGTYFDDEGESPKIVFAASEAERLREDWDDLVGIVSARRGRYSSRFPFTTVRS